MPFPDLPKIMLSINICTNFIKLLVFSTIELILVVKNVSTAHTQIGRWRVETLLFVLQLISFLVFYYISFATTIWYGQNKRKGRIIPPFNMSGPVSIYCSYQIPH